MTITISRGPDKNAEKEPDEVETIVMPDLSDMTESAAKTTLKNNKLSVGTVKSEYHDTVEEGLVISQSVLKDVDVEVGTTIDIVISLGPKPEKEPAQGDSEDGEKEDSADKPTDTTPEEKPDNSDDTNDSENNDSGSSDDSETGNDTSTETQ